MDNNCEGSVGMNDPEAGPTENSALQMELDVKNEQSTDVEAFKVNMNSITCIPSEQQAEELRGLGIDVYDQTVLEEQVMAQADLALQKQEEEKRRKHAEHEIIVVQDEIRSVKQRMGQLNRALAMAPKEPDKMTKEAKRQIGVIEREKANKDKQLKKLEAKLRMLRSSIGGTVLDSDTELTADLCELDEETKIQLQQVFSQKETEEERLIRTGEMTPFGTFASQRKKLTAPAIKASSNELTDFEKFLLGQANQKKQPVAKPKKTIQKQTSSTLEFETEPSTSKAFPPLVQKRIGSKKQRLGSQFAIGTAKQRRTEFPSLNANYRSDSEPSDVDNGDNAEWEYNSKGLKQESDDEYRPEKDAEAFENSDEYDETDIPESKRRKSRVPKKEVAENGDVEWTTVTHSEEKGPKTVRKKRIRDDGDRLSYSRRLKQFRLQKQLEKQESGSNISESDNFTDVDGPFKVPSKIWDELYRFQQTGVRWLWELHQQSCGGIIGDEMGLGKTIQVIVV